MPVEVNIKSPAKTDTPRSVGGMFYLAGTMEGANARGLTLSLTTMGGVTLTSYALVDLHAHPDETAYKLRWVMRVNVQQAAVDTLVDLTVTPIVPTGISTDPDTIRLNVLKPESRTFAVDIINPMNNGYQLEGGELEYFIAYGTRTIPVHSAVIGPNVGVMHATDSAVWWAAFTDLKRNPGAGTEPYLVVTGSTEVATRKMMIP